jgi:riboflavin kinase/FMN adenylyltransferase
LRLFVVDLKMSPPAQFTSLEDVRLPPRPLHLAIGMFDGVHLGHQAVIEAAVMGARGDGGLAGVLTFWPHPSAVFNPADRTRMLMNPEMKSRVLLRLGVDAVITQTFSLGFARIEAEEFLPHLQRRLPHLAGLYVGENWRFGAGRRGNVPLLLTEGARHNVPVQSIPRVQRNGAPISSTRIRDDLAAGRLEEVNLLLGYAYFAEGVVVSGRSLGRTLGFPTLNLPWQPELQPRFGVYAVRACGQEAPRLPGVANYGIRPTVTDVGEPVLEVNMLGQCPFTTGSRLTVEWLKFLRPEQRFGSTDELRAQIARDREAAEGWFRQQTAT